MAGGAPTPTLAIADYQLMLFVAELIKLVWVFAFGACIGSLINVLVYRLPLGLGVVTPPSRCPSCETVLTWRENIPVFGWIFLRGKCRFCRSPISAEYPIVEACVGLLWVLLYLACYADQGRFLGVPFGKIEPEWARAGFAHTWPEFLVLVTLVSCLVAMTLVDAKTFQIPMILTWVPAGVALVVYPLHALWMQIQADGRVLTTAPGWTWALASPGREGWWSVGAALGGTAGLIFSNVLLTTGIFKRSFADYEEWEKRALEAADAAKPPEAAKRAGAIGDPAGDAPPTEMWIKYPHARREMLRELIFVAPIVGFAMVGMWAAVRWAAPWAYNPLTGTMTPAKLAPLWLDVLSGVLLGYLIGAGVVWVVRIFGSLAFGKEAMGLGDVHMMGAVGACLGWVDSVLAFFGAAFVGVAWAVLGRAFSGVFRRAMPYGPFLAVATMLVWFCKPAVEWLLTRLMHASPPINLP